VFGVVLWLVLRDRGGSMMPSTPSALAVASDRNVTAPASSPTTPAAPTQPSPRGGPADPAPTPSPSASLAGTGSGALVGAARAPSAAPGSARPVPAGTAPTLPPPVDPEAPAGKLTDRTGWNNTSVAKQLNKELMPLASECIAQAQARNPKLDGMLAYAVVVAPTENGKVIVSSLTLQPSNQINDPELFECIRESSFSLEGLTAPHDFGITMPIHPDGRD
jgi:hypothetical protein